MWLAKGLHIPGVSCIIFLVVVFWRIGILAPGLFCGGWLFFSSFQILNYCRLLLH